MSDDEKRTRIDFFSLFLEYAYILDTESDQSADNSAIGERNQNLSRETQRGGVAHENNLENHRQHPSVTDHIEDDDSRRTIHHQSKNNPQQNRTILAPRADEETKLVLSKNQDDKESALRTLADCAIVAQDSAPTDHGSNSRDNQPINQFGRTVNENKNSSSYTDFQYHERDSNLFEELKRSYLEKIKNEPIIQVRPKRRSRIAFEHPFPLTSDIIPKKLSVVQMNYLRNTFRPPIPPPTQNFCLKELKRQSPRNNHLRSIVNGQMGQDFAILPRLDKKIVCQVIANQKQLRESLDKEKQLIEPKDESNEQKTQLVKQDHESNEQENKSISSKRKINRKRPKK